MSSGGASRRLFFALCPDEALRDALVEGTRPVVRRIGGRPMAAENLHITLVFLGNVNGAQQACAEAVGDSVRAAPFELVLDRYGYFPRPQVFWLGPCAQPPMLLGLVKDLTAGLVACGYRPEARPYHAHLTLARKVRPPAAEFTAPGLTWAAAEFCLVESLSTPAGVRYPILRRWALRA